MKRILALCAVALLTSAGCDNFCFSDDCVDVCHDGDCYGSPVCSPYGGNYNGGCEPTQTWPWCDHDGQCFEGERCVDGECRWDDPTWCWDEGSCPQGQICSLESECREVVTGCPLTDECLGDPEGYEPDWVGIDPLYMGTASGDGIEARMEFLVDFYTDHFYGEAVVESETPGFGYYWLNLIVTGDRSGAQLDGFIVDRDAPERWFDATFEAQLITASEILGTVLVQCDAGTFTLDLHLFRISPCGCDSQACSADTDCGAGEVCQQGACVPGCVHECCDNSDCPTGQECSNNQCVPTCGTYECCVDTDCPTGQVCDANQCVDACTQQECCVAADCTAGDDCVNGACKTPCSGPCECELGEACVNGYCEPASN